MNIESIIIIGLFFIVSHFLQGREGKLYEQLIEQWSSREHESYAELGLPEQTNYSFSALKLKYFFILNGKYIDVLLACDLKEIARQLRVYIFINHVMIVVFLIVIWALWFR